MYWLILNIYTNNKYDGLIVEIYDSSFLTTLYCIANFKHMYRFSLGKNQE